MVILGGWAFLMSEVPLQSTGWRVHLEDRGRAGFSFNWEAFLNLLCLN